MTKQTFCYKFTFEPKNTPTREVIRLLAAPQSRASLLLGRELLQQLGDGSIDPFQRFLFFCHVEFLSDGACPDHLVGFSVNEIEYQGAFWN